MLTGCSATEKLLGLRIDIAKVRVTAMTASLPEMPAIAPGEKIPLAATFTEPNGQLLITEGGGKGKVLWKDIIVTATVVSVKKGMLSLPHDPRVSDGKIGHVLLTVPSHPGLTAELDVPLTYSYPFKAEFAGTNGSSGSDGTNGTDGSAGSTGSFDPQNPTPGGNGGNGTNGTDGGNGSAGSDGPTVDVQIALRNGTPPLLQIALNAVGHKERFYLVDPQGGSLTISSSGGSGGAGGRGGRGGNGGLGGSGSPPGNNGNSGSNGLDGLSGSAGLPGLITVTYDPAVQPFLGAIHFESGGRAPSMRQVPVPALW